VLLARESAPYTPPSFMRLLPFTLALALAGCGEESLIKRPPVESFFFPTGVVHDAIGGDAGTLYVASSDFNKSFDFGAVSAVRLDSVGLDFPTYLQPDGGTAEYPAFTSFLELGITEEQRVLIAPFAGQMASWLLPEPDGRLRLVTPSRAEGDMLFGVDADGPRLSCAGDDTTRDCTLSAPSLTRDAEAADDGANGFAAGKPRAPEPYAVAIDQGGTVFVTHLGLADSPIDSHDNNEAFLVRINAEAFSISAESFSSIGPPGAGAVPSSGIAIGARYAYLSGRYFAGRIPPAIRLIDLANPARPAIAVRLESEFRVEDMRDVVLSADETRLFLITRMRSLEALELPDELLVVDISDKTADLPLLTIVGAVPLPAGPNQARLVPRGPGRRSLVAISCTGANSVALYDDAAGQLANVISEGIGLQPFGLAVHAPAGAPGARLFVSNFGDGQISVIDIRDVDAPSDAKVVARLGFSQLCMTDPDNQPHPDCPPGAR
jgi:hypothetical protein